MKFRSLTILSIVLLFSTSDSLLLAQLFKKAKAAREEAMKEENARLDVNASFYELLQNKQYPVATSLSDAFKSNYSVTELTPYVKEEKASKRILKMNVKGMRSGGGLLGKIAGGTVAKKADLSLDLNEKMAFSSKYGTGYVAPHRNIIGGYNIIGPIFKDFVAPDEEFNLESHDDGTSYMRGDAKTRYWDARIEFGSKVLLIKNGNRQKCKGTLCGGQIQAKDQWLDGDDYFYAFMNKNGSIDLTDLSNMVNANKKSVEYLKKKRLSIAGVGEYNWSKNEWDYRGNMEEKSYVKSTIQEFGYSVKSSDDPDDKYDCFCEAEYFVNDLDKIIESVKNSDLYSDLSELPKGFPKDELPLYRDHLVFWNVKDIVSKTNYNTKLECSFTVKGDSYILNLSDVERYPLYSGSVLRNGEVLYSIKQTLDSEWGGDNYYTPSRGFTVSKNGQDVFAVTSAIEFKPPEQTTLSAKSAFGGMLKGMKAATKAGFEGKDASAAIDDSNPWAESKKIKKSLLINNNVSDNDRLPVYILGTALSHFKSVYGHLFSPNRGKEATWPSTYIGSDRYNPYAVQYVTWKGGNIDYQEGSSGGYESNILSKYYHNNLEFGPEVIGPNNDRLTSRINPEYLFWLQHLPKDVDSIGKGKSVFNCKNCYGDRTYY